MMGPTRWASQTNARCPQPTATYRGLPSPTADLLRPTGELPSVGAVGAVLAGGSCAERNLRILISSGPSSKGPGYRGAGQPNRDECDGLTHHLTPHPVVFKRRKSPLEHDGHLCHRPACNERSRKPVL